MSQELNVTKTVLNRTKILQFITTTPKNIRNVNKMGIGKYKRAVATLPTKTF